MEHTPKKTCDCAETSCPKGCTKQHTHKIFFCETCNPPDATPKEEEIRVLWKDFAKSNRDGLVLIMDDDLIADYWLKIRREAIAEIREKIEEELELSCVDDRLLGKTDEYLNGYNTSTERWRAKRDDLLSHLTQE